jgi:hypothetical protein
VDGGIQGLRGPDREAVISKGLEIDSHRA